MVSSVASSLHARLAVCLVLVCAAPVARAIPLYDVSISLSLEIVSTTGDVSISALTDEAAPVTDASGAGVAQTDSFGTPAVLTDLLAGDLVSLLASASGSVNGVGDAVSDVAAEADIDIVNNSATDPASVLFRLLYSTSVIAEGDATLDEAAGASTSLLADSLIVGLLLDEVFASVSGSPNTNLMDVATEFAVPLGAGDSDNLFLEVGASGSAADTSALVLSEPNSGLLGLIGLLAIAARRRA